MIGPDGPAPGLHCGPEESSSGLPRPNMTTPAEQNTFRTFVRLLAVAQFSLAILAGGALGYIYLNYSDTASRAANPYQAADLSALASHRTTYLVLAVVAGLGVVGGVASGICLWQQRGRKFSLVVAVASLLLFPVGTAIGLATLVTLGQKPVRDLFKA